MKENKAEEKLRIVNAIRENATSVLAIGGFVWLLYSFIIIPIKTLEFATSDIINNHLKTIQDEQMVATTERSAQTAQLNALSESIIRLQEQIANLK